MGGSGESGDPREEAEWCFAQLDRLVPNIDVRSSGGTRHRLRELLEGRWTMLVVASELPSPAVVYPEILTSRFGNRVRYIFAVPTGASLKPAVREYLTGGGVAVVIENGYLRRYFSLRTKHYVAFFLVDPAGKIKYARPRGLPARLQRQLIETHVLGRATVPPRAVQFRTPVSLCAGRVRTLLWGSQETLVPLGRGRCKALFVPAHTPLPTFVRSLAEFDTLVSSSKGTACAAVLTSRFYPPDVVKEAVEASGAKLPVYGLTCYVDALEDPYYGSEIRTAPSVLEMLHGNVTTRRSLEAFR